MKIGQLFFCLCWALSSPAQQGTALSQTYNNPTLGFQIHYPEGWVVQTTGIGGYAVRIKEPQNFGSVFVKVTNVGQFIAARTIVQDYIIPAWQKDGASLIDQPEEIKTMTLEQLEMKNVESGYSCLLKQPIDGGALYIGYIVMTFDKFVYEVKYEGHSSAPEQVVKLLPKIGLSFIAY
jgi:hypothetical protein